MKVASQPHPGLPFVPPAIPDELLGAWLLRIAELYGVSLHALLGRLAALPTAMQPLPHWFAMHCSSLHWTSLAMALRQPAEDIVAMAPPQCRRRRPQEMGLCPRCIAHDNATGRATSWYRRWMHPLVTACEQHRVWLTPVSTRALRAVRHVRGVVDLVACSSCAVGEPLHDGQVFIDDALWLQQLYIAPATSVPIWSGMPSRLLNRIIDALARLMMSDSAGSWARERMTWTTDCAPVQHGDWSAQGFTVNDRRSSSSQFILPTCLRRRQWVLGLVGHLLRRPAGSHASGMAMLPIWFASCCVRRSTIGR